ncbi:hypothetical protein GCM10010140_41450 [Streptosporangium pseudovulgare]|uniref:Helix-turn-helix domain-containing protein n=1 Tax=Streptosporangium pseudovulgare TaxID=35765 RepID=A0ABQ2R2L0_9ACTN|nr:hypothetical protein GCM10010140_41450 [Streptosporangium pseudovulgare]
MRVQRSKIDGSYTRIPNSVLRDRRLSFTARGMLVFLLSLPEGARQDAHTLADQHPGLGRRGVSKALNELVALGYYIRRTIRDPATGRIRTETTVYDTPQRDAAEAAPMTATPATGAPATGAAVTSPEGVNNWSKEKPPSLEGSSDAWTPNNTDNSHNISEKPANANISKSPDSSASMAVIASFRGADARLTVRAEDIPKVAALVDEWFARGADAAVIRTAVTSGMPFGVLRSPLGFILYRLRDRMPTPPAPVAARPAAECDDCARPVRSPGRCPWCVTGSERRRPAPIADVSRHVALARELLTAQARTSHDIPTVRPAILIPAPRPPGGAFPAPPSRSGAAPPGGPGSGVPPPSRTRPGVRGVR